MHLGLADAAASTVQTVEKMTRPTRALTPAWVIVVEGGGERQALEEACAKTLPAKMLTNTGARDVERGVYQLQFEPER